MSRVTRALLLLAVAACVAALGAGAAGAGDAVQAGTLYQSSDLCVYAIAATQHGPYNVGQPYGYVESETATPGLGWIPGLSCTWA